jgi:hypothetical protein
MVTARKFKELRAASPQELEVLEGVERTTRALQDPDVEAAGIAVAAGGRIE